MNETLYNIYYCVVDGEFEYGFNDTIILDTTMPKHFDSLMIAKAMVLETEFDETEIEDLTKDEFEINGNRLVKDFRLTRKIIPEIVIKDGTVHDVKGLDGYTVKDLDKTPKTLNDLKEGDTCYIIHVSSSTISETTYVLSLHESFKNIGLIHLNQEDASNKLLRLQASIPTHVPGYYSKENREEYYYYNFAAKQAYPSRLQDSHNNFCDRAIGNVHKTEEDALEWGEKYAKAFQS